MAWSPLNHQLSEADVQEALAYYAGHQVEIDNFIVTNLGQE